MVNLHHHTHVYYILEYTHIQECGKGGRDGNPCHAVLYTYSGCTRGLISAEMKDYCKDSSNCSRKILFNSFPEAYTLPSILHECCDVCQQKCLYLCTCNSCTCGKEKPCNNCCQCPKRCTYGPMCLRQHTLLYQFPSWRSLSKKTTLLQIF